MVIWSEGEVKNDPIINKQLTMIWLMMIQVFLFPYMMTVYFSINGATMNLMEKGTAATENTLKIW